MKTKTFLDELIDARWPLLPLDRELLTDTDDECSFRMVNGGIMGINRNTEVWWRNTEHDDDDES